MPKVDKKQKQMSKVKHKHTPMSSSQPFHSTYDHVKREGSMAPASTDPLPAIASPPSDRKPPTTKSAANESASAVRESPLSLRVPHGLQQSPSYGKRQRLSGAATQQMLRSNMGAGGEPGDFQDVFRGIEDFSKQGRAMRNGSDDWQPFVDPAEHQLSNGRAADNGMLLHGIYQSGHANRNTKLIFSSEDEDDSGGSDEDDDDESDSESDTASAPSSSSEEEPEDETNDEVDPINVDGDEESDDNNIDPVLKRQKSKYPTNSGDLASSDSVKTSVATRNPPPPEFEGKWNQTNSTIVKYICRYPKVVLDAVDGLETIIPELAMNYIKQNMPPKTKKLVDKAKESEQEQQGVTKRLVEVMEAGCLLITYLGRYRAEHGTGEEGMKAELMRIAKERGEEVERLKKKVKKLTKEVEELKEGTKQKRA